MLKTTLLHPEILSALGSAGHGSKILIADDNYPFATRSHPNTRTGLCHRCAAGIGQCNPSRIHPCGVLTDSGEAPSIHEEFHAILPLELGLQPLNRHAFYDAVRLNPDMALVIATGEQRIFANITLTIGVVPPPV